MRDGFELGRGSEKREFLRCGSIETAGFQGASENERRSTTSPAHIKIPTPVWDTSRVSRFLPTQRFYIFILLDKIKYT